MLAFGFLLAVFVFMRSGEASSDVLGRSLLCGRELLPCVSHRDEAPTRGSFSVCPGRVLGALRRRRFHLLNIS